MTERSFVNNVTEMIADIWLRRRLDDGSYEVIVSLPKTVEGARDFSTVDGALHRASQIISDELRKRPTVEVEPDPRVRLGMEDVP